MPLNSNIPDEPVDPRLVQVRALLAQAEVQARAGLPVDGVSGPRPDAG